MNLSIENASRTQFRLHIIIGILVLITFILAIARLANKGTPSSRSNTWGIAVCVKSAVFLVYQVLTEHHGRFERWASAKANMVLNIIDTVFWLALFIITIMGTANACSGSSCPLGGVLATLAIILWFDMVYSGLAGFLSFICIRIWRYVRVHGPLPGFAKVGA
ncbi:hypothetical protein FE257_000888 [Aspergillus nanangensis]|uniref:MARVEL domain-containing protein n=1 Tax=Aspergillus nanangensis TaxID=2582783 RepID=A0AAD4CEV1_ASPNN|nr:hypothetical protein FE257_000888 [Aspergillus nanangensis]